MAITFCWRNTNKCSHVFVIKPTHSGSTSERTRRGLAAPVIEQVTKIEASVQNKVLLEIWHLLLVKILLPRMSHTHHGQDLRVESQIRLNPSGMTPAKQGAKLHLFCTAEHFCLHLIYFSCYFCAHEQLQSPPLLGQGMGRLRGCQGGGRCLNLPAFGCQTGSNPEAIQEAETAQTPKSWGLPERRPCGHLTCGVTSSVVTTLEAREATCTACLRAASRMRQ